MSSYLATNDSSSSSNHIVSEYNLYAAVYHVGALGGGHYVTTVCEELEKQIWVCFNDETVTEINVADIQASSAYLLFYARKDIQKISYSNLFESFKTSVGNFSGLPQHKRDTVKDEESEIMTKKSGRVAGSGGDEEGDKAVGGELVEGGSGGVVRHSYSEAEFENLIAQSGKSRGSIGRRGGGSGGKDHADKGCLTS